MRGEKALLFGSNPLGLEVARWLEAAGRTFVIVDSEETRLAEAQKEGFRTLQVDYTDDAGLGAAGIGTDVATVFAMLPDDSENVFLAISARALDPDLLIVAVCHAPDAAAKLTAAGADKVVDPYELTGARIHEFIARPAVVDILEHTIFGRLDLNIAEVTVPAQSWVAHHRLSEIKPKLRRNVIVLGVVDLEAGKDLLFGTSGVDPRLDGGDVLVVIGARAQIDALRQDIERPSPPEA